MVHLRHKDEDLAIVALYGVSSPTSSDDKKFMRAQLADALTQIAQEYKVKPFMVVGDYNAAASPEDRGSGKLLPYDTAPGALTVVLVRLSLRVIAAEVIWREITVIVIAGNCLVITPGVTSCSSN